MKFSAAPWDGGDGRHCDDNLAGLCLSFSFSFLPHNLRQDPTARLSGEKRPIFFPFDPTRVYDDGRRYGFFSFYHIKKMHECASNPQKSEKDKRTQVQLHLHS
jgi:hypothetical protein